MPDPIVVVPCDPQWPVIFAELAERLREALGSVALRIDHIGSTAVPGLDAKPIIDVQVSVSSLDALETFRTPLENLGFVHRSQNTDRTKRYFREAPGGRRTHIHVRQAGSWAEQCALLFRDYMRTHDEDAQRYAALKRRLATKHRDDRERYTRAKAAFIWGIMAQAMQWSQETGWQPGPTDA